MAEKRIEAEYMEAAGCCEGCLVKHDFQGGHDTGLRYVLHHNGREVPIDVDASRMSGDELRKHLITQFARHFTHSGPTTNTDPAPTEGEEVPLELEGIW